MNTLPKINILPKEVYQLIAAGEVVERPSSVVKEMIENSIDANSKNITVEIKNGGSTYIRITDDGVGIEKEEVKKVFVSHATSKIENSTDLDAIGTLGFRGEAMASISAVSKVQLLSKSRGSDLGTLYEIDGGEEKIFDDAGCPDGTTIVVRDIFFNTPARMKFLKKDVTEGNSVYGVVERMAISHPEISFKFIRDGKQILLTSGNGELKDAAYSVFGKEFTQSLMEVDYQYNSMRVSGFVSKPTASRKSRAMQFFFINSRLVKSKTAMAALEQAFKNSIMVGKFPACILNIEMDTSLVDVNVHPSKIEVRFSNEKPVFDLVYYGVKNSIETKDTVKEANFTPKTDRFFDTELPKNSGTRSVSVDFFKKKEEPKQMSFLGKEEYKKREESFSSGVSASTETYKKAEVPQTFQQSRVTEEIKTPVNEEKQEVPEEIAVPDFRVIGEAFKTYIIVEIEKELFVIDKHAAHERMNYEKLKAQTEILSQVLLTPEVVSLSTDEYTSILNNTELLKQCGFLVEDFGSSSVIVRECPSILEGADVKDLIIEIASKLLEHKTDITPEKLDWIFHSTSCRAAVKAGDKTTPEEQQLFVKKLLSMPNIRYCPHGRPVFIKISKYDIEKQFGRV